MKAALIALRLAFPSVGTVVSGNVGTVLQKTGILAAHGFSAQITPLPLGRELKEAMAAGRVDAIFTSEANFIVLLAQGVPCRAVATFGTMGEMALVVKPGSPVKKIADLKGKKLATIFGTSLHVPAVDWPREAGLNPAKDVTLVNMRGMGPMNAAFANGDVDAMVTFDPYLTQGVDRGEYRVLRKTGLDGIVLVTADFAKAGRVPALLAALREAVWYVASHRDETNAWAGALSGMPPKLLADASKTNANYNAKKAADVDLAISKAYRRKLEKQADFFFGEKLVPVRPDVKAAVD